MSISSAGFSTSEAFVWPVWNADVVSLPSFFFFLYFLTTECRTTHWIHCSTSAGQHKWGGEQVWCRAECCSRAGKACRGKVSALEVGWPHDYWDAGLYLQARKLYLFGRMSGPGCSCSWIAGCWFRAQYGHVRRFWASDSYGQYQHTRWIHHFWFSRLLQGNVMLLL